MPDAPVAPNRRLPSLTGLRFPLALAVLAVHLVGSVALFPSGPVLRAALPVVASASSAAVGGFFVLSGFILTWTRREGDRARAFWRRRFWKIIPNHVLAWAGAVLFFALSTTPSPLPAVSGHCGARAAVTSLFLVTNWLSSPDSSCFNAPSWSIACEVFFYALFPLLIGVLRGLPVHRLRLAWTGAVILVVAPAALYTALRQGGGGGSFWTEMWLTYFFPPARLAEFVLGILTALLVRDGRWPVLRPGTVPAVFCAAVALVPVLPLAFAHAALFAVPMTLLIAHLARRDLAGRGTPLLSHRFTTTLGEASYALYLTHWPLLLLCRQLLGRRGPFDTGTAVLVSCGLAVLAQLVALLVHRYWERPLLRFGSPRRPPAGPSVPAQHPPAGQHRASRPVRRPGV